MLPSESDVRCVRSEAQGRVYSSEALPLLQLILAMLADLDLDHERERERVNCTTKDPNLRDQALAELAERHRERREPYLQRPTRLKEQMMLRDGRGP